MTVEAAMAAGPCTVVGCDPGPEFSALAVITCRGGDYEFLGAEYVNNRDLTSPSFCIHFWDRAGAGAVRPVFFAYEKCGAQGKTPGESTFETAAMSGEIRRAFRNHVTATYAMRSSDWRHAIAGAGNAKTGLVYVEICALFPGTGGGSDPWRGVKNKPGPLWALHEAGRGGNMDHVKDALGVAMGLTRVRFRSNKDPEIYRRPW